MNKTEPEVILDRQYIQNTVHRQDIQLGDGGDVVGTSPSAIVATKTDIFKTNLSNQIKETSGLNLSLVLQKRAQQMGRC